MHNRPRPRSTAPVTSRCTRYVAIHPIRRCVMPTDRVHRHPQQAQPRAFPPDRPQPTPSDAATRPRNAHPSSEREALHPIRRATPDQKGCNAYGSGAPPPTTSPTAGIPSRHIQAAASDAATQPRNTRPAPNKRRYTRSVALHPIRRGVMPTDRVHRLIINKRRRGTSPTQ